VLIQKNEEKSNEFSELIVRHCELGERDELFVIKESVKLLNSGAHILNEYELYGVEYLPIERLFYFRKTSIIKAIICHLIGEYGQCAGEIVSTDIIFGTSVIPFTSKDIDNIEYSIRIYKESIAEGNKIFIENISIRSPEEHHLTGYSSINTINTTLNSLDPDSISEEMLSEVGEKIGNAMNSSFDKKQ